MGRQKGMDKIIHMGIYMRYMLHQFPDFEVSCTKSYHTKFVES